MMAQGSKFISMAIIGIRRTTRRTARWGARGNRHCGPEGCSGSTEGGCRAWGRTRLGYALTRERAAAYLPLVTGGVSEVEGLGSRVHNDRWGRTAQTKEVDLRRALRGRAGGSEEGPLRADYFLAVLAIRLARKGGGGVGHFRGASGLPRCPG